MGHVECSKLHVLVSYHNYSKWTHISGLKQHRFIILQLYRSDVWIGSHWAKIKALVGLESSLEALGENPFLHLPASRGCLHSSASGPFLQLQSTVPVSLTPLLFTSVPPPSPLCQIDLCLPPIGTLVIMLRVQPDNPGWPSLLKMLDLITSKVHPGGLYWRPVVEASSSNVGDVGLIHLVRQLRSHMSRSQKTKTWNRNSIVANSIKTF